LIAKGEIDAVHLREAIDLMECRNQTLGDLAVSLGLMAARDVAGVHASQRMRDMPFGDLCVQNGLLSSSELVDLLRRQLDRRLLIGDALVELGYLASDQLAALLDVFKIDQSKYASDRFELPDALANHRATRPTLTLLPRFAMRVAQLEVKVGTVHRFESPPDFAEFRVSLPLRGLQGLDVAFVANSDFAERLAVATMGTDPGQIDSELVVDGIGEFLNVYLGNVVAKLSVDGHPMVLGTPDYEATLVDGWIVDLAVDFGQAALVLSLF
jgi:hypothetical protein